MSEKKQSNQELITKIRNTDTHKPLTTQLNATDTINT